MFISEALKTHFETSSTISLESLVLAEWNMNMPDNIYQTGNYRYRPTDNTSTFYSIPSNFDKNDSGKYYTDGLYSNVVIDGGHDNTGTPQIFTSTKEKMKLLYSLEDCLKPFRPRSGINKPLFFHGSHIANSGLHMGERPRYYMPSRYDEFRYWTSYRTEDGKERGIASKIVDTRNYIDDVAPFVVYKNPVPANRIIVKMQTNVGDIDLGPFIEKSKSITDPLYGDANKTTPVRWKIQYLSGTSWIDAIKFDENSKRDDGTAIIKSNGYVELQYGLIIPKEYKNNFVFVEILSSETLLPERSVAGYAYLVKANSSDAGKFHIYNGTEYKSFDAKYGWYLGSDEILGSTWFVNDLTNPEKFTNTSTKVDTYRQFQYISGIRIVVDTMNKFDSTFDLIEMSPRLVVDMSDKVLDFSVTKVLSDVGQTSLPVGQLLASTGSLTIFDYDNAFNNNNTSSIIANYVRKNIKFSFFERILNVGENNYHIPIKTLYSEGIPEVNNSGGTISLRLRDMFFLFESLSAPRLLLTNVSLSYAITTLLDYIGFSNYSFKRINGENDPIIPYFFVAPDKNIAEVLNDLAVGTQSAMFFDEYNNFIVMSKNYMMPTLAQRSTDMVMSGNNHQIDNGIIENQSTGKLPNILAISSEDKKIFNDGKITYTERYIQRSIGSIRQASLLDNENTWIYKPALLWQVAGDDSTKTVNEVVSKQSNYTLSAMPINSNIPAAAPTVEKNQLINNIIDFGESVYYLTRYNGYFYANGEIIKYDAAEFNITLPLWYEVQSDGTLSDKNPQIVLPGKLAPTNIVGDSEISAWRKTHRQGSSNVWISSNQEYQKYFSTLPFNGKIYPTGRVRIYTQPYYETTINSTDSTKNVTKLKNGAVAAHGRGQFGTPIVEHTAGLGDYWSSNDNVHGCTMSSEYLFTMDPNPTLPNTSVGAAGLDDATAKQSTRNGIIKNLLSSSTTTETVVNSYKTTKAGTVQSSALVFNGPSFKTTENPLNFISYVSKNLDNAYKHFGTRMRIIGRIENSETRTQTPIGSATYYQVSNVQPNQSVNIGGGSGGLGLMLNPTTNNGYYFEIAALTENNVELYMNTSTTVHNVIFYKIKSDGSGKAIPIKLWGGLTNINVDDGSFVGNQNLYADSTTSVYDLSVEYVDIGKTRRFYLYMNNTLIKVVDDADPLPVYTNMAVFVRGSARCMFEHVYALSENYSQNTVYTVANTISDVFGTKQISASESFRKYAMSGAVQSTYMSGISSVQPPKYNMYFDEFGTIMRECAYFDIRYDRAYPALYAKLSPVFSNIKGYVTSGFQADSYGAEFLVFNATDKALVMDETSANFLSIQGITFTQETTHEYSVDEYFKKKSNFSDPELVGDVVLYSPQIQKEKYDNVKISRLTYGKNAFSIESDYIQTQDDAESLMGWIIDKLMSPKKAIGLETFAIPTLQLGDIVTVDYANNDGVYLVTDPSTRFVVYNIEYARNSEGPKMTLYLAEV